MVEIREMNILDYQDVIKLWTACEGMTLRDADSKENIEMYLKKNAGLSYVALIHRQIIGAVLAGTDGRRGYLQHLAVYPQYRSNGIGQLLVSNVISSLGALGISKTHLFVHNSNIRAQQFYEKMGWFPRDEVRMFSYNSSLNAEV